MPGKFGNLAILGTVAIVAVAFLDYVNQTNRAGLSFGGLGASAWASTIGGRITDYREASAAASVRKTLRAEAPRMLLPEAPEGWTRRDWDPAVDGPILAPGAVSAKDRLPEELKDNSQMATLAAAEDRAVAKRNAEQVWVYEKPGALVALTLDRRAAAAGGIQGDAMAIVAGNMAAMSAQEGFAVVQGVPFATSTLFGLPPEGGEAGIRRVDADVGAEVTISARAVGSDADLLMLLSAIDFDRINASMDHPVAGIGSAAPRLDPAAQKLAATRAAEAEARLAAIAGVEAETRLIEPGLPALKAQKGEGHPDYLAALADVERRKERLAGMIAAHEAALAPPAATGAAGIIRGLIGGV